MLLIKDALGRLFSGAKLAPFLLGPDPYLPDFHLFHIFVLGKTFSKTLDLPYIDLVEGDGQLQQFYDAMSSRDSTQAILAAQADEYPVTKRELFEDFGPAYEGRLKPARAALEALFGHDI